MEIKIDINKNAEFLSRYGMKWCYDCENFYYNCFCSYKACSCQVYGSLDLDQQERHPDVTAMTCPDYKQKQGKRWFEED